MPSEYASLALSGPARYLVCSKVFSRAKIWCPLKVGLVCFFFPAVSVWCPPSTEKTQDFLAQLNLHVLTHLSGLNFLFNLTLNVTWIEKWKQFYIYNFYIYFMLDTFI